MRNNKSIKGALTALTATLVGSSVAPVAAQNQTETSILVYSESERMRATELNFSLTKQMKNDYLLNMRLSYDALTGATPTGASPSKYPQTITRASGGQAITVPAGEHPVDENFKDARFAGEANVSHPLGRHSTWSLGIHLSSEQDYKSVGVNAGLTREFNKKNTTVGVSAAFSRDKVSPVGGFYVPFSDVDAELNETRDERLARFEGRPKKVYDFVFSLTQVLNRKTVFRANFTTGKSSGYMTDPYKIISSVLPPDTIDAGEPVQNLYENRPGERNRNAAFAEIRRFIFGTSVGVSYRYFWDDWDVVSHSVDVSTRVNLHKHGAFTPRVRWYHQSEASFYRPFLVQGQPLPIYASSDSRLAAFNAITYGLSYSVPVNSTSRLNVSTEYYTQRGDLSPPAGYEGQLAHDLFPKLDVVMIRVGYTHDF